MRIGLLGDFGRSVVADMRIQRSDQHKTALEMFCHACRVGLEAGDAVGIEVATAVGQKPNRLEQVVDDHRLEHVELQMTLARCEADGHVVAHHLAGEHGQRFALGRVDLARHDRAARLVGWQSHFGEASARS